MNLYLVHLGYYDEHSGGVFESHTNIFVVADSPENARTKAKQERIVQEKKMHIDGIQCIQQVQGYRILLEKNMENETVITSHVFRELATKSKK